jgi:hypothetical protein
MDRDCENGQLKVGRECRTIAHNLRTWTEIIEICQLKVGRECRTITYFLRTWTEIVKITSSRLAWSAEPSLTIWEHGQRFSTQGWLGMPNHHLLSENIVKWSAQGWQGMQNYHLLSENMNRYCETVSSRLAENVQPSLTIWEHGQRLWNDQLKVDREELSLTSWGHEQGLWK